MNTDKAKLLGSVKNFGDFVEELIDLLLELLLLLDSLLDWCFMRRASLVTRVVIGRCRFV